MKRKTQEEKEDKLTKEVIAKFIKLERKYTQKIVKRACYRYNQAILEKNNAEKEIKILEQKLNQAKEKLK